VPLLIIDSRLLLLIAALFNIIDLLLLNSGRVLVVRLFLALQYGGSGAHLRWKIRW